LELACALPHSSIGNCENGGQNSGCWALAEGWSRAVQGLLAGVILNV
jgi:hypothetical protein